MKTPNKVTKATEKSSKTTALTPAEKLKTLKELQAKVEEKGLKVRREKLTRGFGYTVAPGVCRLEEQKLVFVNTHTRIEEQISFLEELLIGLNTETRQAA